MINIILSKIVDSLDNDPEHWVINEYDGDKYASRHLEESDTFIEVFEDRIEHTGDRSFILNIPEDLRWEIKYALKGFVVNKLRVERILAEQEIYKVVSGW